MDERESIKDIFIDMLSIFTREKKSQEPKTDFLERFIMGNVDVVIPFGSHMEYLTKFFNVIRVL